MVTKIDFDNSGRRRVYFLRDTKTGGNLGGFFTTIGEARRALVRNRSKKPLFDRFYNKIKGKYILKSKVRKRLAKTANARRVLRLMDQGVSFTEAVRRVMKKHRISRNKLEGELEPFI